MFKKKIKKNSPLSSLIFLCSTLLCHRTPYEPKNNTVLKCPYQGPSLTKKEFYLYTVVFPYPHHSFFFFFFFFLSKMSYFVTIPVYNTDQHTQPYKYILIKWFSKILKIGWARFTKLGGSVDF
jgi:hypothetical protein